MHVTSVERPEVLQPSPAETALPPRDSRISHVFNTFVSGAIGRPYIPPSNSESLPLRHAFDEIIRQNFGQESKARNYLNKVEKVKDVGYLAITKWQNRELSLDRVGSWIDKRPGLRRTITLLGSTAAVTTVWTLASRATQAYAMTKHGMDLSLHGNMASAPTHASPLDSIASSHHGSIDVAAQASAPTSESVHLAASTSEEWNYSSGAKTISPREGWFNQFRQMDIHGNNAQLDSLLRDVGDNLHDRGLAYYDHDAQEWRMKLVDPNSSGSGYHHTQGTGSLREQDLDYIMREAANHNLVEHDTTGGSANHQHPPTEPGTDKPNTNKPPATSDPDLKDAADNAKDNAQKAEQDTRGWWNRYVSNPWDNYVDKPWGDFVNTITRGAKEAWEEWRDNRWLRLVLGAGTLAAYGIHEIRNNRHPRRPRPLDPLYPTGPSPFDPPFARHSHVPPLTNRGRASEGLSKLRERASTSGLATKVRERWADRRRTSVPASRKDPVSKP